ncbi:MAG TPA: nuclear transport factor 2 family protein [Thermodesulfobacteriota bacterium]|nr:nuclear transport factor 2 family protein [Thermodesulfobacteriota bacterium]
MTDEERKSIASEYLKRLDRGEDFFELFDENAEVFFPRSGVAVGADAYKKLFSDLAAKVKRFRHHHAYLNWIIQGDMVVAEGSSEGELKTGEKWTDSKWCDVFEIRNGKIQRLYIYLDPEYSRY